MRSKKCVCPDRYVAATHSFVKCKKKLIYALCCRATPLNGNIHNDHWTKNIKEDSSSKYEKALWPTTPTKTFLVYSRPLIDTGFDAGNRIDPDGPVHP